MHTKRPWGTTNYSNGPQCLYLPCKWCIQRIGTGLCGRLSAHPCPPPQKRNRNTHCANRSIEIDEISITSIRRKRTGILSSAASNYYCLIDFDYIKYILTKVRSKLGCIFQTYNLFIYLLFYMNPIYKNLIYKNEYPLYNKINGKLLEKNILFLIFLL